jgi:hypothetical protein
MRATGVRRCLRSARAKRNSGRSDALGMNNAGDVVGWSYYTALAGTAQPDRSREKLYFATYPLTRVPYVAPE